MPFTFSHIAAVLPLLRNRKIQLSSTGLVLGSITPDFEKFLRLSAHNGHSHSWLSLLYFSCPVALLLAFYFHGVVRNPLIAHLPLVLRQRLARYQGFNWPRHFRQYYGRFVASVVLGGATHLVWDSFTHYQGELVAYWSFLDAPLHVGSLWFPGFVLMNLLSSLVGAGLVLAALWRLPPMAVFSPMSAAAGWRYWGLVALTAVALVVARVVLSQEEIKDIDLIISVISGSLAGLALASERCPPVHATK